jgi:hypothetical protein
MTDKNKKVVLELTGQEIRDIGMLFALSNVLITLACSDNPSHWLTGRAMCREASRRLDPDEADRLNKMLSKIAGVSIHAKVAERAAEAFTESMERGDDPDAPNARAMRELGLE